MWFLLNIALKKKRYYNASEKKKTSLSKRKNKDTIRSDHENLEEIVFRLSKIYF